MVGKSAAGVSECCHVCDPGSLRNRGQESRLSIGSRSEGQFSVPVGRPPRNATSVLRRASFFVVWRAVYPDISRANECQTVTKKTKKVDFAYNAIGWKIRGVSRPAKDAVSGAVMRSGKGLTFGREMAIYPDISRPWLSSERQGKWQNQKKRKLRFFTRWK